MNDDDELNLEDINTLFTIVFGEEGDEVRLERLCKYWDIALVDRVLNYLLIYGLLPPREGQKHNPYGLLFVLCGKFNDTRIGRMINEDY